MLQPNIKSVTPMEQFKLYLEYENGEKRIFDVNPYLKLPFYRPLNDISVFNTVHVVDNGWTVEWCNGRDISPYELYENSYQE